MRSWWSSIYSRLFSGRSGKPALTVMGLVALTLFAVQGRAMADATIPAKDIPGAKDSSLLKRYGGSHIVSYERVAFTDFRVPLSKLEQIEGKDTNNNTRFEPRQQKELEGALTRLVYLLPAERSPLEVLRNYQDDIETAGGQVLFTCKTEGCGGDHERSSSGGGGDASLLMYFVKESEIKDASFSNGSCALASAITDQRFFSARIPHPEGEAHVTVQTYQLRDDLYCKAFNNRTIAVVHILEPRARDRKMTTVRADEMARSISSTGRVALYGIFFDTAKADLTQASDAALAEIAALLKSDPKLAVLIVGHTDNQGGFDYNIDLSRRRADAVVRALATTFKVDPRRLRAAGAGMIAPAAANDAEDGRARNRRVEVVKLN